MSNSFLSLIQYLSIEGEMAKSVMLCWGLGLVLRYNHSRPQSVCVRYSRLYSDLPSDMKRPTTC